MNTTEWLDLFYSMNPTFARLWDSLSLDENALLEKAFDEARQNAARQAAKDAGIEKVYAALDGK